MRLAANKEGQCSQGNTTKLRQNFLKDAQMLRKNVSQETTVLENPTGRDKKLPIPGQFFFTGCLYDLTRHCLSCG